MGERVLVCGDGQIGHQLGHGATGRLKDKKPRKVDFFEGKRIRQVAAGSMHSVVLLDSGEVYTCGSNDEQQQALGRPEVLAGSDGESEYGKVAFPEDEGDGLNRGKIVQVVAGVAFTAALSDTGVVWLWGTFLNSESKGAVFTGRTLGKKGQVLSISPRPSILMHTPSSPGRRPKARVTKIAGGNNHLCLLMSDGQILTCGIGEAGCLGRAPMKRGGRHVQAQRVATRELFDDVWAFGYSVIAMAKPKKGAGRSRVFAWGLNNHGQLGLGEEKSEVPFPTYSGGFDEIGAAEGGWKSFAGEQHVIGLTNSGKVFGCGLAQNSLLGRRDEPEVLVPIQIPINTDSPAVGLSASEGGNFVYCADGKAYSWGANNGGELGLGLDDGDEDEEPNQIKTKHLDDPDSGERFKVIGISANSQHTIFLAAEED